MRLPDPSFNVRATLDETMKALAVKAHAKGLELTCHLPQHVPERLVGDPWRLRQIVSQLVDNAVKFTERGEIAVRVAVDSQTAGGVCLRFSVADTGIGIAPEDRAKLSASCDSDESPTAQHRSGLFVASRLAALMGGRLWNESELGCGSTFGFTAAFPIESEPAPQPGPDSAILARLPELSVLAVDDSATSREILAEFLTGWSMHLELASDGPTALTKFRQATDQRRPFGLLIIDATLPDQDGFALVRQLREIFGRTGPTILMLPSVLSQTWQPGRRRLRNTVSLQKPVTRADLLQAIGRALGRRSPPRARRVRTVSHASPPSPLPAEVFSLADALEGVDGRLDRWQRMVEFYFSEAPLLLAQVQTGLQSQDASAIARAAHRLAGTLVYLRAQPALVAARRVDDLSVSGDLEGAAEAIPTLEHELALLDRALIPHRAPTQRGA